MMDEDLSTVGTKNRLLANDDKFDALTIPKDISIPTKHGPILVTQQGPTDRTVMITYHDVGYNSTQFHQFFALPEMMPIVKHFTIYHINAPGQEDEAERLPTAYVYPTMDELAETVNHVLAYLNVPTAIGFGIGLGANVLTRFALKYPSKVFGLILVNCISRAVGLLEGWTLKWPTQNISEQGWTESLMAYLLWYHLGPETQSAHPSLVETLRNHLADNVHVENVVKLLNSFFKRTAIPMVRPSPFHKIDDASSPTLKCSVMNITGVSSPHKDDVIETNDRCDPKLTTYLEFPDCGGAILDEQPARTAEAIRLYLQGLGYMSYLSIQQYSTANRLAEQTAEYKRQHGSFQKVPRRLSAQLSSVNYQRDSQDDEFEEELQDDPKVQI